MDTDDYTDGELMPPIHPGVILNEGYLEPLGISHYRLAQSIHVSQNRISEIVRGKRRISPDTALRLDKFLGLSEGFWIRTQADYDRRLALHEMGDALDQIEAHRAS